MVSLKVTADHKTGVLHGWVQAVWQGQTGRASCSVCERAAGIHGALPCYGDTAVSICYRLPDQEYKAAGPEVDLLQTTGGSLMLAGPGPHEGFQ